MCIDLTQLVASYVSNPTTFRFDHIFELLSRHTNVEPYIIRICYRCNNSDNIHIRTVSDTKCLLKLMSDCEKTVDYYASDMLTTIPYCMMVRNDLSFLITSSAIKHCKLNIGDIKNVYDRIEKTV